MAGDAVEILIRARNEANAAVNQAIAQLKGLEAQGVKAGIAPRESLRKLSDALALISPQVGNLTRQMAGLAGIAPLLGPVAVGVLAIGAAFGPATAAAKGLADEVERLDNLSLATGSNLQDVQVIGEVFERAGLGASSAEPILIRLNKAIGENHELLKRLGITTRDPVQALLQLSRVFATSSDEALKTRAAFELMGRGSADVLKVIGNLSKVFPELRAEMESTKQLIAGDMVDAARELDKEWEKFTGRWRGFWNQIGGVTAEGINAVVDAISRSSDSDDALERQAAAIQRRIGALTAMIREERAKLARESAGFAGLDELFFGKGAGDESSKTRINDLTKQVESLDFQLRQLRGTARGMGEDDLPLFAGAAEATGDVLAAAFADAGKAIKTFEEQVAEAVREMSPSFKALVKDALTAADAFDTLAEKQRKIGRERPQLQPSEKVPQRAPQLLPEEQGLGDLRNRLELREVAESFARHLDAMSSAAVTFANVLDATFQGVAGVFNVFTDALAFGADLMKVRVGDAFRAMFADLLRAINQFLAAQAVKSLLKFLGIAIGGPVGAILTIASGAGASASTGKEQSRAPAIDTEDLERATKQMQAAASSFSRAVSDFEDVAPAAPAGLGPRPVTTAAAPTSPPGSPRLAPAVTVQPRTERVVERFQSVLREVRAIAGPTPVVRVGAPRTFERERISTTSTRSIERLQTIFRDFRAQVAAPIIRILQPRSVERERVTRDTTRTTERLETATRSSTVLERNQREMSRSVERFQTSVREFRPSAAPALRVVTPRSVERSQTTLRETRAPAAAQRLQVVIARAPAPPPALVRIVQAPAPRVTAPPAARVVAAAPRVPERAQAPLRIVTAPPPRAPGSAIFRTDPRPVGLEGVLRSVGAALAGFRTGLRLDALTRPLRDAAAAFGRSPAGAARAPVAPPALRVVERAPARPTTTPPRGEVERTQAAARPLQALAAAVARPRVQAVALAPAAVVRVAQVAPPVLRLVERAPAARATPDRRTDLERTQAAARPVQALAAAVARPRVQTVALAPAAVVRVTQLAASARPVEAPGLARALAAVSTALAGLRALPRDLGRVRVPTPAREIARVPQLVVAVPMPSGARSTPSSTPQGSQGSTAPPSRRTIHFNVRAWDQRSIRDSLRSGELRDALEREAKMKGW